MEKSQLCIFFRSPTICATLCGNQAELVSACTASSWNSANKECKLVVVNYTMDAVPGEEVIKVAVTCFTSIVQSDPAHSKLFLVDFALTDSPCDDNSVPDTNRNYLLAPGGVDNFEFVIGFGCLTMVAKAQLRNTHNGHFHNSYA